MRERGAWGGGRRNLAARGRGNEEEETARGG